MKNQSASRLSIHSFLFVRNIFVLLTSAVVIFSQTACSSTTGGASADRGASDLPASIGAIGTTARTSSVLNEKPMLPRMKNDCLPQAIGMQQALEAKKIKSKIMVLKPATGLSHATVVFEYRGENYVWDTQWGAAPVVGDGSAETVAREWLAFYGIPGESRTLVNSYYIF